MQSVISQYLTLMPLILAGILNMIFCKLPVLQGAYRPMDGGLVLRDGKRLFGNNKTWKGFFGMIILGAFAQLVWGWFLAAFPYLERQHLVYQIYPNQAIFNLFLGALLGLSYVLFELPNSFIKRRLSIKDGKTANNSWKWLFIFIDQIDSLLGAILVLVCFIPLTGLQILQIILLGTATHLAVNRLLFWARLRKNQM